MSYVDELLATNEEIKYEAHQHPFVFFSRILAETIMLVVLLGALYFTSRTNWNQREYLTWGLVLISLLVVGSGVFDFLRWRNERFLLTDRRVIHLRGVINKATIDSSLDKINDVQTRQTFFGRMFNYGDLEIQTASEDGSNYLPQIRAPLDFKRAMLNAKAEHERPPAAYQNQNTPSIAAYQNPAPAPVQQRLSQLQVEEMLVRLNDLRQKNLITDADFESKKREILSQM
jgi:uncharacterized membrane protein YdbT with pleckstrin-like domain